MSLGKVIYTGLFRFPEGDAAARRVLGIGKCLKAYGYDVVFAGCEEKSRDIDINNNGKYIYQGFEYYSVGEMWEKYKKRIEKITGYFSYGRDTVKWLDSINDKKINAIIVYNGNTSFLIRIMSWCKRNDIKIIVDCTEWYSPNQLKGGRFGVVYIDSEIRIRFLNKRIKNIISISSYLEKYYKKKGCNVIRVPPLIDIKGECLGVDKRLIENNELSLVYAGIPGKKDLINNIIKGVLLMNKEGYKIILNIIGPTKDEVKYLLKKDINEKELLIPSIIYHGHISQKKVIDHLKQADYSVLLRPIKKYSKAGFPTKITESLSAGLPIITNYSSDIREYVKDTYEGIVIESCSVNDFVSGLKKAISIKKEEKERMRIYARLRAEKSFDFRVYVDNIGTYIKNC
jgi:glycosyltransferase involved in cell wall biosynthesis